ncbi:MAG TPA: trypsin-like peptidase domain-containing protein [Rhizomicrobium sp.]|jgi:serine protease Do|nr:trypsin-like peptidase domain-containing protein [Bryobacteraceae bacterium]
MFGFGEIAERLRRSTVQVFPEQPNRKERGSGSGVIWRPDGAVLTNSHVARSNTAEVELWDGRRFSARVISRDSRRDLALLSIESASLESATRGDSGAVRAGEFVLAIGNPLGFAGAISRGVVHSIGRIDGMGTNAWIRAGVQLAPGNSGGPLINARGEVIGINTAILNGLGLAIPSNTASEFVNRGPRPSLGVTLQTERNGLRIIQVEPNGPAAQASLKEGDLLLGTFDDLSDALDTARDVLALKFLRTNRLRETHVRFGVRAEAA